MTPVPAVECTDLVVRYGERRAVDGLSFVAHAGEVLALLGPNGAGKTTTVESLMGYRRPDQGRLRVLGLDPRAEHDSLVRRAGIMLQRGGVYPMLSAVRALTLFAAYYDEPDDVGRLLDLVDLRAVARTPWRHLSGGEQQRLSLALALVGRPEVVFLDEPTAGVDPEGRLQVRAVIAELRRQGVCILLTTHELPEAEHLADRVVIIRRGRAVATGSPDELVAGLSAPDVDGGAPGGRARRGITFGSRPGLDTDALAHTLGVPVVEERPGRYRIDAASNPALTASLATFLARHDADLADLHTGRTLEEAYLEIVGGPERGAEGGGHGGDRGDGGGGGDPGPRGAGRRRRRP